MKRPHLLAVAAPPGAFAALFEEARGESLRIGWLELTDDALEPLPDELAAAAGLGVLRAVAAGARTTVAVKPRRDRAVLDDLLREHFLGTALVLVRGSAPEATARLTAAADGGWRLETATGSRSLSTADLVGRLRRPRPW